MTDPRPGAVYPRAEIALNDELALANTHIANLEASIAAQQVKLDAAILERDTLQAEIDGLERL